MNTSLTAAEKNSLNPRWDEVRERFALLPIDARRAVVVAAARRALPVFAAWAEVADHKKALAALDLAVAGGLDDKARERQQKALAKISKAASAAAGRDRVTGIYASPQARAAGAALQVVSYALAEHPPVAALPFGWESVEFTGGGFDGVSRELDLQVEDVRRRDADSDDAETWPAAVRALVAALVPPQGPAPTEPGEMVRCVTALADEALRNGNVNFGDRHRAMVAFVHVHLPDPAVFDGAQRASLVGDLFPLAKGAVLGEPSYRVLARAAVRWCRARGVTG